MRAKITASCRAVALETIQDNLSFLLALVQVLIVVFASHAPDEMEALVQVAGRSMGAEPSLGGFDLSEPASAFSTSSQLLNDSLLLLLLLNDSLKQLLQLLQLWLLLLLLNDSLLLLLQLLRLLLLLLKATLLLLLLLLQLLWLWLLLRNDTLLRL